MRHFLDWRSLSAADLNAILSEAVRRKSMRARGDEHTLAGKSLAMIFEKNSTRTR
ncbi:MAG: ornithine carbamoyltransferase, partial [Alphaproteobacteria bacterium]